MLVAHALTGDRMSSGAAGPGHPSPGWWDGIVGPGAALDAGALVRGVPQRPRGLPGDDRPARRSTADGTPWGSRFPTITIRDQVAVEIALADHLGIDRWAAVVGGSMGGMRVLEWAVAAPTASARAMVVACGAAATAEQIALCAIQAQAIRLDPGFAGGDYYDAKPGRGPVGASGLARRLGHLSYRAELELAVRFGRSAQDDEEPLAGGRYQVESYLDHQALKLAARFDANSYLVLSRAMDHHDIGPRPGRGRRRPAPGDRRGDRGRRGLRPPLSPAAAAGPGGLAARPSRLVTITSAAGHDGFLVEADQIDTVVASAVA